MINFTKYLSKNPPLILRKSFFIFFFLLKLEKGMRKFTLKISPVRTRLQPKAISKHAERDVFHKCPFFQIYGCSTDQRGREGLYIPEFFLIEVFHLFFLSVAASHLALEQRNSNNLCCKQKKSWKISKTCFLIMVMLRGFQRIAHKSWNIFQGI